MTTEVIQSVRRSAQGLLRNSAHAASQFLDDNQHLIQAILENQSLGKLDACALCVPACAAPRLRLA